MAGSNLSTTDVAQRLRAFNEEAYEPLPDEAQRDACLEIYRRERNEGTEMPAIIGAVQQFVEEDKERRNRAQQQQYRERAEAQRLAAEERLLSGADCKWTPLSGSKSLHCRVNGRTYRLEPQSDKRLHLFRVNSVDDRDGDLIGHYSGRGDATKVVSEIAFKPKPRWR